MTLQPDSAVLLFLKRFCRNLLGITLPTFQIKQLYPPQNNPVRVKSLNNVI